MKKRNRQNIFVFTLLKVLLAFGTLMLTQIAFHLANLRLFHIDGIGEWAGIVWGNITFGFATVAAFLSPFILLQLLPIKARWKRWYKALSEALYVGGILLMIIPRGADMPYYQYTYRLLSDEIFSYLGIGGQMGALVPHFLIDYWYAWAAPLVILVLFFILNIKLRIARRNPYNKHTSNDIAALFVGLLLLWFAARGGFGHFLQPTDAAHFCQPKNTALVNNDAYNILRTSLTPDLAEVDYMPEAEANAVFPAFHTPLPHPADTTLANDSIVHTPRNIMIIIVESLGQEFMGCYNSNPKADTRTPFLDELAKKSTLYDGRANGKKSIEGITAINTSIPNLMSIPLTNSAYAQQPMPSLAAMLKHQGYHTAFFHGSYNGVMAFDSTCFRIGFDEYLGKNEYEASRFNQPGDYDGVWGIFDDPFLQYTVDHINTYTEPFLAEVFTVTSHHPFPIPDGQKERYVEGRHPILKCVEYTDQSLRNFFDQASRQPWFNNTLFIICGDHSGHGLSPEYNDYDGWYRIPMMIYDPQHPEGRRDTRIVQQIDLLPTLADYLHLPDSFTTFGQSALRYPTIGRYIYYANGYHAMISNHPESPTQHDLTVIMGDREIGTPSDITLLKAIIQQYNSKVINHKLCQP